MRWAQDPRIVAAATRFCMAFPRDPSRNTCTRLRCCPLTLQLLAKAATRASVPGELRAGGRIAALDLLDDLRRLAPRFGISPWCPPPHTPKNRAGDRRDTREAGDGQVLLLRFLLNSHVEVVFDSEVN